MKLISTGYSRIIYIAFVPWLLLFSTNIIFAQNISWAVASRGIWAGYKESAIDAAGNIIVAGYASPSPDYTSELHNKILYGAQNDTFILPEGLHRNVIISSYTPEGKLNWVETIYGRSNLGSEIVSDIKCDKKGNIFILFLNSDPLFSILTSQLRDDDSLKAAVPKSKMGEYPFSEYIRPGKGTYILNYNLVGKLKWVKRLENFHSYSDGFQLTKDGGYVISGNTQIGDFGNGVHEAIGKGQNDFILKLDSNFKAKWARIIQYTVESCCTGGMNTHTAISSSGNVYLTGRYFEGGHFSRKLTIKAPVDRRYDNTEAYLACYSRNGELKWVKTSHGRSIINGITATNKRIYITGELENINKWGDTILDTASGKSMFLMAFNNCGKVLWGKTASVRGAQDIVVCKNKRIYVTGEVNRSIFLSGIIGTDTLNSKNGNLFVACFSDKGQVYWAINLLKLYSHSAESRLSLTTDGAENLYVAGEIFCGNKCDIPKIDNIFKNGYGNGGIPFVIRIKDIVLQKD